MSNSLPFVRAVKDRYGEYRYYFQRAGSPRVRLPCAPGEPTFEFAYREALAGRPLPPPPRRLPPKRISKPKGDAPVPVPLIRGEAGSFNDLCARYYRSERFTPLARTTKTTYRNLIERLRNDHGDKPIAMLDPRGVKLIVAPYSDRPATRNHMLKALRALMDLAVEDNDRPDNPCLGIRNLRYKTDGFRTWQEEDIGQFLDCHPDGSRARLAIALALYTGQRRSDLVRLGWKMVRRGRLQFKQQKTGQSIDIPIAPRLLEMLEAQCPKNEPTFLMTMWGNSFTAKGFGQYFRAVCDAADLPLGFSSHGLRKAVCRRLAEAGCTPHEIMAISGHKTLAEVERYTKEVSRTQLADAAMTRFGVPAKNKALPNVENSTALSYWAERILALPREISASNDNMGLASWKFSDTPVMPRRIPQL